MPLTDTEIRKTAPRETQYRLADGGGMYLEVKPSGAKYWRLKYRFNGKEKVLALGVYPTVSLKDAREKREAAKRVLAGGDDPGVAKKTEKRIKRLSAENSFEAISLEWHAKFSPALSKSHGDKMLSLLKLAVNPYIGARPIADLEPPDVLDVMHRIERTGAVSQAHRVRVLIGQVMRYAIATGRAKRDIAADLKGAIPPVRIKHHAAITDPAKLGDLLRAIHAYKGSPVVGAALQFSPLVFQRPGEIRGAEWAEIDLDAAMWTIPAARMKRNKTGKEFGPDHLVPLSSQAVKLLRDQRTKTGKSKYVFPSRYSPERCMSDPAMSVAFKRMGFDADTALPHGWRATARTLAVEELGFPAEVVEMQLAHDVRDSLGRAYNRTQWLDKRRELMQRWADYLDGLREKAAPKE